MKRLRILACALLGIGVTSLSGCAGSYQLQTNKAVGYNARVEKLFVWTAVGSVGNLGAKNKFTSWTFLESFHSHLKRGLEKYNIPADVREFTPKTDSASDLARFEQELGPNMRLLIQPTRVQTITYQGSSAIAGLWLDLSLIDLARNERVWRGELYLDAFFRLGAWGESGAEALATQVIEGLIKDSLI